MKIILYFAKRLISVNTDIKRQVNELSNKIFIADVYLQFQLSKATKTAKLHKLVG